MTHTFGTSLINIFDDPHALNQNVAHQIIREFQRPGLIILPADSTHGHETGKPDGEIYRLVNNHFAENQPNSELRVTHMDELNENNLLEGSQVRPEKFADKIRSWLENPLKAIGDRFHAINPSDLNTYKAFVEQGGGARVIVGGVGAEVPPHIAYIGEAKGYNGEPVINDEPVEIKLRDEEAKRRGVISAVTMGMGFFNSKNLEKVIITAKGEKKDGSVLYAFKDGLNNDAPQGASAFGELIRRFRNKTDGPELVLNFDRAAFQEVFKDPSISSKLS